MNKKTKMNGMLSVYSLNINHSNAATHVAMHMISRQKNPKIDLLLIQEPWWEKVNENRTTVSFKGWQPILPKLPIKETERPRVAAYYQLGAGIKATLRTDIATDLNFMTLDMKRAGMPNVPVRLINIYNQSPLNPTTKPRHTAQHLMDITLDPSTPTVITRDWNMRHLEWDDQTTSIPS